MRSLFRIGLWGTGACLAYKAVCDYQAARKGRSELSLLKSEEERVDKQNRIKATELRRLCNEVLATQPPNQVVSKLETPADPSQLFSSPSYS